MYESMVNYWAVLVSALVFFGIGAIWYGPVFGKAWIKSMGLSEADLEAQKAEENMVMSFGLMFVSSLLMALATAYLIDYLLFVFPDSGAVKVGLTTAFFVWVGYTFSYLITAPAFEKRPWSYVWINGGYWLVGLAVTGIIVGLWR
ncbi:MAG: DUF1761 domain-containing protein [Candidatus Marinimicrobia bacterium]|nr:DUF1761 domain-containing protein [FCB group bacterium]MBL7023966.1 DUF1761 domain-containing protein [Candidatus Neomarinimicrobiota bacterium]